MNRQAIRWTIPLLLAAAVAAANDDPAPPSTDAAGSGTDSYRFLTEPLPRAAIADNVVGTVPTSGPCWLTGLADVAHGVIGGELTGEEAARRGRLDLLAGFRKGIDLIMPGGMLDEPVDWITGLLSTDWLLAPLREPASGSPFMFGLRQVGLAPLALSPEQGIHALDFYLGSFDRCRSNRAP